MYVTDTHPLIYYSTNQKNKLSKKALKIFTDCEERKNVIYIPAAVLLESSTLMKVGKVKIKNLNFSLWCDNLFKHSNFLFLPLEAEHIIEAHSYHFHNDIFDLLIVATAKILDVPLITKDSVITDANVIDVVW